ncbi:porin [Bradyrhizobium sp. AUGA SZCCT0177]|uniref:porin n=1 Tax=Bradyrhizobium sp. AUGA SZCCT0177 TaxID=2807665 RepID=UPI001BA4BCDF|nr:porin [Bradyrhizobium sp. AUGA SZCCT0177]MBR1280529.1 porin [Bradyrhizobium sp. AUGA SZCCT0177]
MRKSLLAIPVLVLTGVAAFAAEPSGHQKSGKSAPSDKLLPLKGATSSNPCAAYGAGFVRVEGTETCAKVGGAISIEAGTSARSR